MNYSRRPARSSCVFSPPTVADTTDLMNSPEEMFPLVNCRYTHGETCFTHLWIFFHLCLDSIKKYCSHIWCTSRILRLSVCFFFRMDATLKELTSLVKEVYPEARKKGTHFSFNIVYPDPRGKMYRLALFYNRIRQILKIHSCGWYILTCVPSDFADWKTSAVLCLAGKVQMTPWHCSHSASRLETIWTSPLHRLIEPLPWIHEWGLSKQPLASVLNLFFIFLFFFLRRCEIKWSVFFRVASELYVTPREMHVEQNLQSKSPHISNEWMNASTINVHAK